jgi:hypothetical protein
MLLAGPNGERSVEELLEFWGRGAAGTRFMMSGTAGHSPMISTMRRLVMGPDSGRMPSFLRTP